MSQSVFAGGRVLLDGELRRADVVVDGDTISEIIVEPVSSSHHRDLNAIDCTGRVVAPGFIDLQCNGAVGADLTSDPGRILDVAAALPQFGVTAFLPTVVTAPVATRAAAIAAAAADSPRRDIAAPLGLHFEGPLISRDHLGAHPGRFTVEAATLATEIDVWLDSGTVALVTLAPELDGAIGVIDQLSQGDIVVSAGHTGMSPADFAAARAAGVSYVTHLYNAMAPFTHRSPGPIGAVLADATVVVGLICDGVHVEPTAVEMAWRALGPARLSLVSDASPALGQPYGRFRFGDFEIIHDETGVRTVDGVLAGSALPLDRAVRNLIAFTGCSLADALATVTSTPADLLGLSDRGRVCRGARADLTILDDEARLYETVIGGETAWRS